MNREWTTSLHSTRGFILPLVILAMLALTSLSLAAFALAGTEFRATEWERAWVGGRAVERDAAGSELVSVASLGGGYHLVASGEISLPPGMPGPPPDPRLYRVAWCLDAQHEASTRPPLSDDPRVGPLGPADLLAMVGTGVDPASLPGGIIELPDGVMLGRPPGEAGPVLVLAGEGGTTLVVAAGNLVFRGGGSVRGLVVIEGQSRWEGGSSLVGGLWSGAGTVGDPPLAPSPLEVTSALRALPGCPRLLHDLGRIGRF